MSNPKDPVYNIVLVDKANKKRKTYAGVAFHNEFDGLSILLNPGVVIDQFVAETCWINAVPYRRFDRREAQPIDTSGIDEDIPFGKKP